MRRPLERSRISPRGALLRGALCAALLVLAGTAQASDRWGGSLAAVSDYVYRGISQTRGEPALQAGLSVEAGAGWSIGAWASNVDLGRWNDATHEVNASLNRHWMLDENWGMQLGYTRYFFRGERTRYDYDELLASLSYRQRITATVSWSPNLSLYSRGTIAWKERAVSYELSGLHPLSSYWSFTAGAGYYDLDELFGTGYWYWSAGFVFAWESLQADLMHIGTDETSRRLFDSSSTGSRLSAGLTWRF